MLDSDSLIVIFYALPVYQLLFYTIQFITFKKSFPQKKYFGFLMLCMAVFLFLNAYLRLDKEINLVYLVIIPVGLLMPPILYHYILSLLGLQDQRNRRIAIFLFIPALVVFILNIVAFESSLAVQRSILSSTGFGFFRKYLSGFDVMHKLTIYGLLLIIVGLTVYLFYRFLVLMRTSSLLSHEEPKRFALLRLKYIKIIILCVLIFFAISLMQLFMIGSPNQPSALFFNAFVLFSGGLAGYYGMKQNTLLIQKSEPGSMKPLSVNKSNTNQNQEILNRYSDDEVSEIINKIEQLMQHEKPFLVKRYSFDDLCNQTNLKRHQVTTVLNEVMGINFNAYINEYRIREAIRILETDNNNCTMDAVADMAGFHSRSTFYTCFKSYTGQSPKEYLQNNKSS